MNKKQLLKALKKEHNKRRDKALIAAEKMYDWLKENRCDKECLQESELRPCCLVKGHKSKVSAQGAEEFLIAIGVLVLTPPLTYMQK
jgi:hypothetical protein